MKVYFGVTFPGDSDVAVIFTFFVQLLATLVNDTTRTTNRPPDQLPVDNQTHYFQMADSM